MSTENRSEWACLISAMAAPILLWCAGASWVWVLLGGLGAVLVYGALVRWHPDGDVTALTRRIFGPLAAPVLWIQAGALALGAAWLLRHTDGMIPNLENGYPWIAVTLGVLALAGAWHGRKAAYGSGAVLIWLITVTVGVVLAFSIPDMQLTWMRPAGDPEQVAAAMAVFLLPVVSLYSGGPVAPKGVWVLLATVLLGTTVALVTVGCLSPRLPAAESLPFFILAAACRPLGYASRFDAVFCMTVAAAVYCLLVVLLRFAQRLYQKDAKWPMCAFLGVVLAASWLIPAIPGVVIIGYLVVAWGIIPICCVFAGLWKKVREK